MSYKSLYIEIHATKQKWNRDLFQEWQFVVTLYQFGDLFKIDLENSLGLPSSEMRVYYFKTFGGLLYAGGNLDNQNYDKKA